MNHPVILVGTGEMGGVFARGLLRIGKPVYPVLRNSDIGKIAEQIPEPEAVLVTVGESDLHATLNDIPTVWRERLILIQNELLPRDWQTHGLAQPTVVSVWFEKKPGQDYKVLISSPVFGPRAALIRETLTSIDIPCHVLGNAEQLLFELVRKNVYILTTNIAGLEAGGTVSELWRDHQTLALRVAEDVLDIQDWLTGHKHNRKALIEGVLEAFEGDPDHKCMGRSAPARLERALLQADEAGLAVHKLREISSQA